MFKICESICGCMLEMVGQGMPVSGHAPS